MGTKWGPKDSFGSPLGPMWCMNVGMDWGGVKPILAMPGFWNTRTLSIVASRIYALFVAKSTSVPGLEGGGVKPILAMPGFWQLSVQQ